MRRIRPRLVQRPGTRGLLDPPHSSIFCQYAADRGLQVNNEFVDVETAKHAGRTAFGEMTAFFRKAPTTAIVFVEKTDRLYRNLRDWVTIDELGVEIHFVNENVVLSPESRSG